MPIICGIVSVAFGRTVGSSTPRRAHRRRGTPRCTPRRPRRGTALLVGAVDDLVVDVGDVLDEADVEALPLQVAADHVEGQERARVADVDVVVDRRAADVHRDLARLARDELLLASGSACCRRASLSFMLRGALRRRSDLPVPAVELDRDRLVVVDRACEPVVGCEPAAASSRARSAALVARRAALSSRSMRRCRQRNISTTGSGRSSWCRSTASTRSPERTTTRPGTPTTVQFGRHVVDHDRAAADLAAAADRDVAEHRRADADDDAVLERRVALAASPCRCRRASRPGRASRRRR